MRTRHLTHTIQIMRSTIARFNTVLLLAAREDDCHAGVDIFAAVDGDLADLDTCIELLNTM